MSVPETFPAAEVLDLLAAVRLALTPEGQEFDKAAVGDRGIVVRAHLTSALYGMGLPGYTGALRTAASALREAVDGR